MAYNGIAQSLEKVQQMALLDALSQPYGMEDPKADLVSIRVQSDNMEPMLRSGDFVIVDQGQRGVNDGLFAFDMGPDYPPRIANAQYAFDKGVRIFCDNMLYPDQYIPLEHAKALVLGRVVGICKHV